MPASTSTSAADFIPKTRSLARLADAAAECQGCPLYRNATQTVFGAGPRHAEIVLVGEQPGDQEDKAGKPFVGPAGQLLFECLAEAGLRDDEVYVTNAVKHFKYTTRGKRRLHKKPNSRELSACRPWIEHELEIIAPRAIVCLGAAAAASLMGPSIRVTRQHGEWIGTRWSEHTMATWHPSAVLRAPESKDRAALRRTLVSDLRKVRRLIHRSARSDNRR